MWVKTSKLEPKIWQSWCFLVVIIVVVVEVVVTSELGWQTKWFVCGRFMVSEQ